MIHQRLRLKRHVIRLFNVPVRRERIFHFTVKFFTYKVFASLFKQIYCSGEHRFTASSSRPFIIDCGNNIGMSVLYFKLLYPESQILALEPDRKTFSVLEENVHHNGLTGTLSVSLLCLSKTMTSYLLILLSFTRHEIALRLPGNDIFDAPAGHGALTQKLLETGRQVTAADIDTGKFMGYRSNPRLRLLALDLNEFQS